MHSNCLGELVFPSQWKVILISLALFSLHSLQWNYHWLLCVCYIGRACTRTRMYTPGIGAGAPGAKLCFRQYCIFVCFPPLRYLSTLPWYSNLALRDNFCSVILQQLWWSQMCKAEFKFESVFLQFQKLQTVKFIPYWMEMTFGILSSECYRY